jgi:hypothetical protein
MKKIIFTLGLCLVLTQVNFAQTKMKEYKTGHVITISLPDYMTKTVGLNSAACLQFIANELDLAGFVIEDSKEEIKLAELQFASINAFYDDFIKDFLVDEEKRKVSKPVAKKIGSYNFLESDCSYYDKELQSEIYYFVGIVETPTYYYKVLCWGSLANKTKYKADFQKILYSLKD